MHEEWASKMPLGDRLNLLTTIAPGLVQDPATGMAMAESSLDDNDLVKAAQTYNGTQYVRAAVDQMQGMKDEDAWNAWKRLDTATQDLYTKQTGWKPDQYQDKSILRKITKTLGALGNIADPGELVTASVGDLLQVASWAEREVKHIYRFGRETVTEGGNVISTWNSTANGEKYYNDEQQDKLRKIAGVEHYDMVIALAGGDSVAEYLEKKLPRTSPDWDAEVVRLYGLSAEPEIQEAVNKAMTYKISLGRDIAGLSGAKRDEYLPGWVPIIGGKSHYEMISGGVDAAFTFFADPTLIVGKAAKTYKIAKWGMTAGEDGAGIMKGIIKFQELHRTGKAGVYGATAEEIADAFRNGSAKIAAGEHAPEIEQLISRMPKIQGALPALSDYHLATGGIKTADDVFDFYKTGAGQSAILANRFGSRQFAINQGVHFLPSRSVLAAGPKVFGQEISTTSLKEGVTTLIDNARFKDGVKRAAWDPRRITGQGVHIMTQMLPKTNFINPDAPDSVELLRQMLGFHLPKGARADFLAQSVLNSPNFIYKQMVTHTAMSQTAEASGMLATPKGKTFWNKALNRSNQAYSALDIDKVIMPNGESFRAGVWIDQMAQAHAIPAFKDMMIAARNSGQFIQTTQNAVDAAMQNVWKPSVLLRVGFIPRAFGEEMIWTLARFGPKALYRGHLQTIAAGDLDEPLAVVKPLLWAARGLESFAPRSFKRPMSAIDTLWEAKTTALARAKGWENIRSGSGLIRQQAFELLTDVEKRGLAHQTIHFATANRAQAEAYSARNQWGMGSTELDNEGLAYYATEIKDGQPVRIQLELKGFQKYENIRTDSMYADQQTMWAMNQFGDGPDRELLVDIATRMLYPSEMESIRALALARGIDTTDIRGLLPDEMSDEWEDFISYTRSVEAEVAGAGRGVETRLRSSLAIEEELTEVFAGDVEAARNFLNFVDDLSIPQRQALFSRKGALDDYARNQGVHVEPTVQGLTRSQYEARVRELEKRVVEPDKADLEDYWAKRSRPRDDSEEAAQEFQEYLKLTGDDQDIAYQFENIETIDVGYMFNEMLKREHGITDFPAREGILNPAQVKADLKELELRIRPKIAPLRTMVARQQREAVKKLYAAMDKGQVEEVNRLRAEILASRLGGGDLEETLQRTWRANFKADGTASSAPVAKGMHRVYTITVPDNLREARPGFIPDTTSAAGEVPFAPLAGEQAVEFGLPGVAGKAWFSSDFQQVRRLKQEMSTQLGHPVEIGFTDIPTKHFNQGRSLAQQELAGGMASRADVRKLSQVYVDPIYRTRISVLPENSQVMVTRHDKTIALAEAESRLASVPPATTMAEMDALTLPNLPGVDDMVAKYEPLNDALPATIKENLARYIGGESSEVMQETMPRLIHHMQTDPAYQVQFQALLDELGVGEEVVVFRGGPINREFGVTNVSLSPKTALYFAQQHGDDLPKAYLVPRSAIIGHADSHGRELIVNMAEIDDLSTLTKSWEDAITNQVAAPGIDRAQLLEEWARVQASEFDNIFSNPLDHTDERDLRGLAHAVKNNGRVQLEDLDGIQIDHLPKSLEAPVLALPKSENIWMRGIQGGFDLIGRAGDALVRTPLYNFVYAEALENVAPALRHALYDPKTVTMLETISARFGMTGEDAVMAWQRLPDEVRHAASPMQAAGELGIDVPAEFAKLTPKEAQMLNTAVTHTQWVEAQVAQVVAERTMNEVIPFIDDHRLRSQFHTKFRNILPFQFAEEQFIKRWARTIGADPTIIRKAALTMQGMRHVGMIETNEYGEDIYVFPGSEHMMGAVSRGIEMLTGRPAMIPIANPFTGQLKYTTPGLDRIGLPNFGPLLGVPLAVVKSAFPEVKESELVQGFENYAYGERGARGVISQIVPASMLSMYNAVVKDPDSDSRFASAYMQGMAYMEASGQAPPDDATPGDVQKYKDRLRGWARSILMTRAALQFFTPATPGFEVPDNFSQEFKELIQEMPYEEAFAIFIERHPDAEPWTVFNSTSYSGAPLPSTDTAYKVLKSHESYFAAHPNAGPWFLPQSADNDAFSRQAFNQQLADGLRIRKSPEEYWRDIQVAQASEIYYNSSDKVQTALEASLDKDERESIREQWKAWKEDYFSQHPIFAEELRNPQASQRRQRILTGMMSALDDPKAPKVPQTESIRSLINAVHKVEVSNASWEGDGSNAAREAKEANKEGLRMWANHFLREHPEAAAFYNRVIRPDWE